MTLPDWTMDPPALSQTELAAEVVRLPCKVIESPEVSVMSPFTDTGEAKATLTERERASDTVWSPGALMLPIVRLLVSGIEKLLSVPVTTGLNPPSEKSSGEIE